MQIQGSDPRPVFSTHISLTSYLIIPEIQDETSLLGLVVKQVSGASALFFCLFVFSPSTPSVPRNRTTTKELRCG